MAKPTLPREPDHDPQPSWHDRIGMAPPDFANLDIFTERILPLNNDRKQKLIDLEE